MDYASDKFKDNYDSIISEFPDVYVENPTKKNDFAYLTWRLNKRRKANNFREIGEGYLISAISSIERCIECKDERLGDAVAFPIMFNSIHGIELYFKAILFKLYDYGEKQGVQLDSKKIYGHEVLELCDLICSWCDTLSLGCEDMGFIRAFLEKNFKYTNDTAFARYPYGKHEAEQFFVAFSGNIAVDLEKYYRWCTALFYVLDKYYTLLCIEIDEALYPEE